MFLDPHANPLIDPMDLADHADPRDVTHYHAISGAIAYLVENWQDQPSLETLAGLAGMSPYHFQRLFTKWAGISPKRFIQFLTLEHAKRRLEEGHSVLDTALDVGLSGPSRLHDLFVACEAVTPGGYKALGAGLVIKWGRVPTAFGPAILGVTDRGLCWVGFADGTRAGVDGVTEMRDHWPLATLEEDPTAVLPMVERVFGSHDDPDKPLSLLLRGTNFQVKVWEALLRIPDGSLVTYEDVARAIGQPKAARAVGMAIARNPLALIIPCHRVIQKSGIVHHYRYGERRKRTLIAWEQARAVSGDGDEGVLAPSGPSSPLSFASRPER